MRSYPIDRLQGWFLSHCDGRWEHTFGLRIETLDNPGWHFEVSLHATSLEKKAFQPIEEARGDLDWLICRVEDGKFQGFGGPENLSEMIDIFLRWADDTAASEISEREG